MKEIFEKIPDMISAILKRASSISSSGRVRPEQERAKQRLMSKLQVFNEELKIFSQQEGSSMSEEQKKELSKMVPGILTAPSQKQIDEIDTLLKKQLPNLPKKTANLQEKRQMSFDFEDTDE